MAAEGLGPDNIDAATSHRRFQRLLMNWMSEDDWERIAPQGLDIRSALRERDIGVFSMGSKMYLEKSIHHDDQ